jgi:hypothetical protein
MGCVLKGEREEVCYVAKGGMTSRAMGLVLYLFPYKHAHSPDRATCSSLIPEVRDPRSCWHRADCTTPDIVTVPLLPLAPRCQTCFLAKLRSFHASDDEPCAKSIRREIRYLAANILEAGYLPIHLTHPANPLIPFRTRIQTCPSGEFYPPRHPHPIPFATNPLLLRASGTFFGQIRMTTRRASWISLGGLCAARTSMIATCKM